MVGPLVPGGLDGWLEEGQALVLFHWYFVLRTPVFGIWGLGFGVWGLGWVRGLGCGVWGLGLGV
jgi:hypothetical protein